MRNSKYLVLDDQFLCLVDQYGYLKKIFPGCFPVASTHHILINVINSGTESMLIKLASVREEGNFIFKERTKNIQIYKEK